MIESKDSAIHVSDLPRELAPRLIVDAWVRRSCLRCKVDCLVNSERGEVNIILRGVLHIAAVVFENLLGSESVVEDIALYRMIFFPLVGKSFEESAAT
jgi:hypothetical protein